MKSPINVLKALGVYRKNNLLDEVLKMYKRADGEFSGYVQPTTVLSERQNSGSYDAFGNLAINENSTNANTGTNFGTNKVIII
jgi:hypothetical protein